MYTQEELSKMTNLSVGPRLCETINKIVDKDEQITVKELLDLRARNTGNHIATLFDFILYEVLSLASELDIVEKEREAVFGQAAYYRHNMIESKCKVCEFEEDM